MAQITLLAMSGSLRKQSYNTALLRAAADVVPHGVVFETVSLGDLPLYDDDVRLAGYPAVVQALRDRVGAADALLLGCPEYNFSISGVLKNAIDWLSRPPGNMFQRKPVAITGAATGLYGSVRAQLHLRQIMNGLDALVINKPEVMVTQAAAKFDNEGQLSDETARTLLRDLMAALAQTVEQQRKLA
jgi:chromate reductase, NAD(P)H dehydrogenase (quinone)